MFYKMPLHSRILLLNKTNEQKIHGYWTVKLFLKGFCWQSIYCIKDENLTCIMQK